MTQLYYRPANDRGATKMGWLDSRHTFSFGHYHDPRHMGFSVLRVINDDRVTPGAGFDTHGHDNMEIISVVLTGSIKHKDSMGHEYTADQGEIQIMSAGTGVTHSEFNASDKDHLHFLQIWILPKERNIEPQYGQMSIDATHKLTPLVTPVKDSQTLWINQDAEIHQLSLQQGQNLELPLDTNHSFYLHMIEGNASGIESLTLQPGDGLGIIPDGDTLTLQAQTELKGLWFKLPKIT